jgi:solute carrier family 25 S-adenosylmethionine transporter 26
MNEYIYPGVARGLTISLLYPLDTLKTIKQNNFKINNIQLYNGYRIALLTQIPYGMLVFGTYEKVKKYGAPNIYNYIVSAIFSDFCGSLFLSPCEVIKQNIQIGKYKSITETIKYENNRLYKGYYSLLLRDIPFRAIQLPIYDKLKENSDNNMLNGAFAGMFAGFITNPVDVIKTKIMCSNDQYEIKKTIINIYNKDGILGFLNGIIYRTSLLGLSSAIFFIFYENLRNN